MEEQIVVEQQDGRYHCPQPGCRQTYSHPQRSRMTNHVRDKHPEARYTVTFDRTHRDRRPVNLLTAGSRRNRAYREKVQERARQIAAPAAEAHPHPAPEAHPSARHDGQADQQVYHFQALQNAYVAETRESRRLRELNQRLQEEADRLQEEAQRLQEAAKRLQGDSNDELHKFFGWRGSVGVSHIIIPDTSFLVDLEDESAMGRRTTSTWIQDLPSTSLLLILNTVFIELDTGGRNSPQKDAFRRAASQVSRLAEDDAWKHRVIVQADIHVPSRLKHPHNDTQIANCVLYASEKTPQHFIFLSMDRNHLCGLVRAAARSNLTVLELSRPVPAPPLQPTLYAQPTLYVHSIDLVRRIMNT